MADADLIQETRDMLGQNPEQFGWDDVRIEAELDAGNSSATIARKFWESRMVSQTNMADMSESGSSRSLSQIFKNAQAAAAYFQGREAAEDPANQPASNNAVSRPIRRV
jgi:hypothetical protein